jgi:hypothetical protein
MSIHAKRAAAVLVVLATFAIVSPGWCITLMSLVPIDVPGGALPRLVVVAMILSVLMYWASKRLSHAPAVPR